MRTANLELRDRTNDTPPAVPADMPQVCEPFYDSLSSATLSTRAVRRRSAGEEGDAISVAVGCPERSITTTVGSACDPSWSQRSKTSGKPGRSVWAPILWFAYAPTFGAPVLTERSTGKTPASPSITIGIAEVSVVTHIYAQQSIGRSWAGVMVGSKLICVWR